MKIALAIISIVVCLWAWSRHRSIRQYAEINIPSYMRSRTLMISFALLCLAAIAIDFIVLFNIAWYWCILIAIPSGLVLFFISGLLYEVVTQANYNYVTGGTGLSVWIKLIISIVLAIIAISI